jgi:hypothetical protein
MRVIVDFLGQEDNEGSVVVYNDCEVLEAVDGDE